MSAVEDRIKEIKQQSIGNTGVRVLLVEGIDDVAAFKIFLDRQAPGWERQWHIEQAGNKKKVLEIIAKEATWFGLVDRDEWTSAEMQSYLNRHPNLLVLPRFCLESYLVDPVELWTAFPAKQQQKVTGGLAALQAALDNHKKSWIRHAALWHVIQPLWRALRTKGFPDGVLDTSNIPDDQTLLAKLKSWHDLLDAAATLQDVQHQITHLQGRSDTELFAHWIYSKRYYPEVVHPLLDQMLGQKPAKERRLALLRTLQPPADLLPLWRKMELIP